MTRPGRSAITTRPAGTSTSGTSAATNGHERVAAVGRTHLQQVLARRAGPPVTSPSGRPSRSSRGEADELVVVELLGVLGRLVGRDVGVQQQPARGLGGRAVGDLLEADQQASTGASAWWRR